MEPREKSRAASGKPGRLSLQGCRWDGPLRWQGAQPAQPRAFLFPRIALDRRQDRIAGARHRRSGNHSGGQRARSLALEHNLIKQYRPKFNVVLRDDKTYPYIKFTAAEKFLACTSRGVSKKTGSLISARIFHRVWRAAFCICSQSGSRSFLHGGLTRSHPRPCLQYYIKRCLGPCVAGLTTDERYAEAAADVRCFSKGPARFDQES